MKQVNTKLLIQKWEEAAQLLQEAKGMLTMVTTLKLCAQDLEKLSPKTNILKHTQTTTSIGLMIILWRKFYELA